MARGAYHLPVISSEATAYSLYTVAFLMLYFLIWFRMNSISFSKRVIAAKQTIVV